jgi:hypothetical protein
LATHSAGRINQFEMICFAYGLACKSLAAGVSPDSSPDSSSGALSSDPLSSAADDGKPPNGKRALVVAKNLPEGVSGGVWRGKVYTLRCIRMRT